MPYGRHLNALTTQHTQAGLLMVCATWGLSYMMPAKNRVPFSEVFPPIIVNSVLGVMWVWGLLLFLPAVSALIAEQVAIRNRLTNKHLWGVIFGAHILLAGVYIGLAAAALASALAQIPGERWPQLSFWEGVVSAASRPVLWGLIGSFHIAFARMPRPGVEPSDEEEDHAV